MAGLEYTSLRNDQQTKSAKASAHAMEVGAVPATSLIVPICRLLIIQGGKF
jgi:hypothetical protein